jgi:hypothetical protein
MAHQSRFDLAETLIDLVGQFVRVLMIEFKFGMLGVECVDGRLLVTGEIGGFSLEFTQAIAVSVGEIDRHRNPLPAFCGNCLCFGLQLFGDKTIEQGDVLQPTAVVMFKKVAQDAATRLFVGIEPNEARTRYLP